ncbi:hypothetical protein [Pseudogracilibacillus sp. SO30301A]|uniref:hypothetical protein n=1 Tax=Pseudogracilibacillus sp. SO30301A TaxID=3098291 RepID=UPI00300DFB53
MDSKNDRLKDNSKDKNKKGDEDMNTVVEPKPVKSLEINFDSDKQYDDFVDYIKNPPAPSKRVKELIKEYRKQSRDK